MNNMKETTNEDVIVMFLQDSFPKDKRSSWGTKNLKIEKKPDGWALDNYGTTLLFRKDGSKDVSFNDTKYSVSTSTIQNKIKSLADEYGIKLAPFKENKMKFKKMVVPEGKELDLGDIVLEEGEVFYTEIKEDSYVAMELAKLLPINEYGAKVKFMNSNYETKWMNLNEDFIKELNRFFNVFKK